jgi:hypothetical protein
MLLDIFNNYGYTPDQVNMDNYMFDGKYHLIEWCLQNNILPSGTSINYAVSMKHYMVIDTISLTFFQIILLLNMQLEMEIQSF